MKPTTLVMSLTLSLALTSCAEQYESIYLNAQEGELRVQLQNLHPAAIDSAIFRLTGTGPLVRNEMDGQELVLDLAKVAMGQHLTEVEVHSHMLEATQDKSLALKRHDILNTYILLHTPEVGIAIPGPGDKDEAWTTKVEAYYHQYPERMEVQALPQSAFVGVGIDSSKTLQQLTLSRVATVAGRKAEPINLKHEKIYTAAEFYQMSSDGRKMYDDEGFAAFQKKLKNKDLRRMAYKYKVQYTDGTTREFEFSVRL
ncbi:hypothetical protein [Haliscomenobacter hydrossis]|nr:hypothetical protein [Haliscomenobacter hydrossis]